MYGVATLTKMMDFPSGDQFTGDDGELGGMLLGSVQEPEVRRVALAKPSALAIHKCDGSWGVVTRKSLLPISKDRLWRSIYSSGS